MASKALTEHRLPLIAVMLMATLMPLIVDAQVPTVPPAPPTATTPTPTVAPAPPTTTTTTPTPTVAPPPTTPNSIGCTNAITALLPCANYVTGTNGTATPACCNAFVAVIINNAATCLCQFLSTQNPLGLSVNQTEALALPAACNVTTPSLATQCAAIGVPLTPTSGLPVTPTSPGSSPVPIASAPTALPSPGPSTTAPTALPSPGPSTTGETPGTAAIQPKVGNPSGSGLPVSTASGGSSSRPNSNSGVSVSAQLSSSLIMAFILASAFM